jgi:iron complex outermembrane recepter protein
MGLARSALGVLTMLPFTVVSKVAAQDLGPTSQPAETPAETDRPFKKMSLDELMNIEVTLVSKRPEKLTETASAIQVITGEDIRRSGATNLPEALRLAPNLNVAQVNSWGWVISARGFSGLFANKLLVMIDGRSVYTPLFAGVAWDVQNVVLEDIDRIEVVSGPGGTLWGSNAVNGVINVVTKSAKDTQGVYAHAAGGSFLHDWGAVRYGGAVGSNLFYRVYAQRTDRENTFLPTGEDLNDEWGITHGGFRLDYYPSHNNTLTLQGDVYGGQVQTEPSDSTLDGQYILGRWTRTFSPDSELTTQFYVDRTYRQDIPGTLTDQLNTYDIDVQHRFPIGERNSVLWGFGYRRMDSDVNNSTSFVGFIPSKRHMDLISAFVQDEFTIIPERLKLTIGTKIEHNDFSGFEVQPSARIAWTPDPRQTIWAAVSRAVRSPSRIDTDYHIPTFPVPPTTPSVDGGPNFDSEKLMAYELGYRVQPTSELAVSIAGFYNRYDDIYSVEALPGTQTFQIQNGIEGQSWGAEISATYQPAEWIRFRGGYTYFHKDLWNKPGHSFDPAILGNDPRHQAVLHTMIDLPWNVELDVMARYVSELPNPSIPGYCAVDVRLAKQFDNVEIAVVGQNLLDDRHPEFLQIEIPRGVYGKVTVRW